MIAEPVVRFLRALAASVLASNLVLAAARDPSAALLVTRSVDARDCPDSWQLAKRLHALTGKEVLVSQGTAQVETSIEVDIWRSAKAYQAVIRASGNRRGTRELSDAAATCASLADAVTLALAMLLDDETPSASALESATGENSRGGWPELGVEFGGGVGFGVLAHARPLLEAGVVARWAPWFQLGVGVGHVFQDDLDALGGTLALSLSYASVSGCVPLLSSLDGGRVEVCLKPMFGVLKGDGWGYLRARSEKVLWRALGASAGAQGVVAGDVQWVFRTLGVVTLGHHGFAVEANGENREIFVAPTIGGVVTLGLQLEL